MTLTLLLDLDDTLLQTNQEVFVPAYFQALSTKLAPQVDSRLIAQALLTSTDAMNQNEDASQTLSNVFDKSFYPQLGLQAGTLDSAIKNFYENIFPSLKGITAQNPAAKPFVDWAHSKGYRLVIATDPLLPQKATYHRVRWAGFEPEQFELITTYENFHFSKTHVAYYAEVLGRLGWQDGPVLMVGNDMERDILPAKRLGLATYFVTDKSASDPEPEAGPHGTLSNLRRWLESTDLSTLMPSFTNRDAILAILASTPAVLCGLLCDFPPEAWSSKATADDWTMTELLCHLRDTEREIHQMQLDLFEEKGEPFIPRPDTGVWASQRDYMHENGDEALKNFMAYRQKILNSIKPLPQPAWERKARHAIFGPTNFQEVIGFMADHDRLHIQQAWSILGKLPFPKV